ncbi:MAG: GAF domain-containing protein [Planctomycetes bacterium]|nr:GAF domain-containing protein [Planctomycetota bacterium]
MSLINVREKTIQAKIVYYGTGLSGKTTSLKHVHKVIDPDGRVELVSLNTEGDRTFFFDFLPIPLGNVHGYQVKLQAFTVPGQVKYNLTRRYVLRGADAVIFVGDSQPAAFDDNVRSMLSLIENLIANGLDPDRTPILLQYNKRDAPGALPIEKLREALNQRGLPEFETTATDGTGVFEAFSSICGSVSEALAREYRVGDPEEARQAVERRLRATLLTYRRAVPSQSPAAAGETDEAASGTGTCTGLAAVEGDQTNSVIEVSSLDLPDVPNAESLLQHAVETNIQSARLLSELTETKRRLADHARQLAALHQTGVALSSELDVDRLLDSILASALRTVDASHGSVLLLDAQGGALRPRLVHGLLHDPIAGESAADPVAVERILRKKPFILEIEAATDVVTDEGEGGSPMIALVAPVVHQGEVLGALSAYVLDRPLDQDLKQRLRFLNAIASQASVALVNARLVTRIESFNRDLERKVTERTRDLARAVEELKSLDRLKDDFLASMSHELLTPLHSIGSAVEILVSLAADPAAAAGAERLEFTTVVQRECARLTSMLRSVLDLSQLESGGLRPTPAAINLRDAALASYQRLRSGFKSTQTKLKIRVEAAMPDARADPAWVGRVFDAILSNAVKFGPRDAEVHVTIRRDGADGRVEIRDHGPGVPEALRSSVFEKFKQVGDVLTEKPPGLGLGLPTARLLVQRMGGTIRFAPGPDGGSEFSFTLPLCAAVADPIAAS